MIHSREIERQLSISMRLSYDDNQILLAHFQAKFPRTVVQTPIPISQVCSGSRPGIRVQLSRWTSSQVSASDPDAKISSSALLSAHRLDTVGGSLKAGKKCNMSRLLPSFQSPSKANIQIIPTIESKPGKSAGDGNQYISRASGPR